MERLGEYNFVTEYIQGKKNQFADMLSRYPTSPPDESDEYDESECICRALRSPIDPSTQENCRGHNSICRIITSQEESPDPLLQRLIKEAEKDTEYQMLVDRVNTHMDHNEMDKSDPIKKEYNQVWNGLSIHQSGLVVLNNERIVVPKSQRENIICEIHKPHTGINNSQRRARRDYYWPGLDKDIAKHVTGCEECIKHLASLPQQPIINRNKSTAPMEVIAIDLFQWGRHHHLVIVDQFSGYVYVQRLASITTLAVKRAMGFFFNLFGNPYWVIQDNGTQLASREYMQFLEKRGIQCAP